MQAINIMKSILTIETNIATLNIITEPAINMATIIIEEIAIMETPIEMDTAVITIEITMVITNMAIIQIEITIEMTTEIIIVIIEGIIRIDITIITTIIGIIIAIIIIDLITRVNIPIALLVV